MSESAEGPFALDGATQEALIATLATFVSPAKQDRMAEVLAMRTRALTVVLEDIYQPHNASAVVRSCDLFGVQDVHIIENRYAYRVNRGVTLGSSRWVTIHRYREPDERNTERCIDGLRARGYEIVATTLRPNAVPIDALPIERPMALLFGTEESGLSEQAHALADRATYIPMVGFTNSFNISVSAALCLYELAPRLRRSALAWRLTEDESRTLLLEWMIKSVRRGDLHVKRFLEEREQEIPARGESEG